MNILLTGGAGYIGSHTAVALSLVGHRVVIIDNFCNSQPESVQRIQQITGQLVTAVRGDIRDTPLLNHTLQQHSIDTVIHFAGL